MSLGAVQIIPSSLGLSGGDSWKVKWSFLHYLEALPAKHKQAVHGKKACT